MSHDEYSIGTARAAAQRDELGPWVAEFLASAGSDNAPLGAQLLRDIAGWVGPVQLPLNQLERLAGPPGEPVLVPVEDDHWDERVDDMAEQIEDDSWEPAPLIVRYHDGAFSLEDGNHRVESLRRAGRQLGWAVVGFDDDADRADLERAGFG